MSCCQNCFEEIQLLKTRSISLRFLTNRIHCCFCKRKSKGIVGNVNVRAMNFAYEIPWYAEFLNRANLFSVDGFGVLLGANLNAIH
jgi:N-acetylglucosaminyldiphosphoundecaprenol N-acetyl-beta-D-mannosaminyltransferase